MDDCHHRKGLEQLERNGAQVAFYYRRGDTLERFGSGEQRFRSASLIKVPILLAWLEMESAGLVSRSELCDLDSLPPVEGAGISWLLASRRLPYSDLLVMMITLSDNLSTNLVIQRAGLERFNRVFREGLGLTGTELQRHMMDFASRSEGRDNWITAADAERLYACVRALPAPERAWVNRVLAATVDDFLLLRGLPRDSVVFHHKTGSLSGVLHDWGYTKTAEMFLLTSDLPDETAAHPVFAAAGQLLVD
jgi:beta-lactamase class A